MEDVERMSTTFPAIGTGSLWLSDISFETFILVTADQSQGLIDLKKWMRFWLYYAADSCQLQAGQYSSAVNGYPTDLLGPVFLEDPLLGYYCRGATPTQNKPTSVP